MKRPHAKARTSRPDRGLGLGEAEGDEEASGAEDGRREAGVRRAVEPEVPSHALKPSRQTSNRVAARGMLSGVNVHPTVSIRNSFSRIDSKGGGKESFNLASRPRTGERAGRRGMPHFDGHKRRNQWFATTLGLRPEPEWLHQPTLAPEQRRLSMLAEVIDSRRCSGEIGRAHV